MWVRLFHESSDADDGWCRIEPLDDVSPRRLVDLDSRDLVVDPAGALAATYTAAGMDAPDDLVGMVDAYRTAHPRHAHGAHRYTARAFGLDPDALRRRFVDLAR